MVFRKTRTLALVGIAVAALAAACGGGGIEDAETVVVAERIEFSIPGAMDEVGVSGVDSVIGEWESATLSLRLDYRAGGTAPEYGDEAGHKVTYLTIDHQKAVIERFIDKPGDRSRPYVAAIYFEDFGDGRQLTIIGRAASEDDQDLLMNIYDTLKLMELDEA